MKYDLHFLHVKSLICVQSYGRGESVCKPKTSSILLPKKHAPKVILIACYSRKISSTYFTAQKFVNENRYETRVMSKN